MPRFPEGLSQPIQGPEQVPLNVVVERSQGRDVQDAGVPARELPGDKLVDCPEEGGQGLAAARRRGDEDMLAGGNPLPAFFLHLGRLSDLGSKPPGDDGVKAG